MPRHLKGQASPPSKGKDMTNSITEYTFEKECMEIAQEIFDETVENMAADETPDHHFDSMVDRVHETVVGHQWIIYTHHAHAICANVNTDEGEDYLEQVGMPETPTYDILGTIIAYGEMERRILNILYELRDEYDATDAGNVKALVKA